MQRRIAGLHQITSISSIDITDTWSPLKKASFRKAVLDLIYNQESFCLPNIEIELVAISILAYCRQILDLASFVIESLIWIFVPIAVWKPQGMSR